MLYHEQSEDSRPLFWFQGRPVHANTLLVVGHVVLFVACALAVSYFTLDPVIGALALDPSRVWHGAQVWRLVSYVAFDPMFFQQRSFWFLWSMLILYFCGREVEQFVGRKAYLALYAALILVPAMLLCLLGLVIDPGVHLNCAEAIFGVFVAFATIYPGAMPSMWISIPIWVLAWILLAISTLLDLAFHTFTSMFMLWTSSAVGYLGMRYVGAGRGLNWLTDWVEERRARKLVRQHQFKVVTDRQATESIDAILEKISKHGVASLDAKEKAALERARAKLIDRDRR
jgi:membrane associated rhomboid family serine protease